MTEKKSLKNYIGLGAAIGAVCFSMLWLAAVLSPDLGEAIFSFYDIFTPVTLISWLVRPSDERGIVMVLGSWALFTMACGMLVGVGIYFSRGTSKRR